MKLLVIVFTILFCNGALAAVVTLSSSVTVNEGQPMVVTCTVDAVVPSRDIIVALAAAAGSTAESGYDTGVISEYSCIVSAGTMAGTVSIPTFIDTQTEIANEQMVISGSTDAPDTVAATLVTFSITHVAGMTTDNDIYIRLKEAYYEAAEGTSAQIVVEYFDSLGARIPLEVNFMLGLTFFDDTARSVSGAGGAPDDFVDTATATLMGSVNGVPQLSATIAVPLVDDTLVENAERFRFTLRDANVPAIADITLDTGAFGTVIILDGDKPGIHVLNKYTTLPRGSKEIVPHFVFTGQTNAGITLTMAPHESVCRSVNLAGYNGMEFRFPKPSKRSRTRITEYVYRARETVATVGYDLAAVTHISATSHKGEKAMAPINTLIDSTVTVYPSTVTGSKELDRPCAISAFEENCKYRSKIRWTFIDLNGNVIRLRMYKRQPSITLTLQSQAGLYAIFRLGRGNKGWVQWVRVILSDCPRGRYHATPGMCDGGPITCQHGGIVDPIFPEGLCTCPPGYIGTFCEIPVDRGRFGHNGQYNMKDFKKLEAPTGRGVSFSFNHPFGNTCAAGFFGPHCMRRCPRGFFGPGCLFTCHCIDELCSATGTCINGCAPGKKGDTCQN